MNLRVARVATLILLVVAGVLVHKELKQSSNIQGSVIRLTSPRRELQDSTGTRRAQLRPRGKAKEEKPLGPVDKLLQEVGGNGPESKKGGHHSIIMTLVDKEAAEVLLPLFLESLGNVSQQLPRRLVVMASDPEALQTCKGKHAYCLPWFQRMNATVAKHSLGSVIRRELREGEQESRMLEEDAELGPDWGLDVGHSMDVYGDVSRHMRRHLMAKGNSGMSKKSIAAPAMAPLPPGWQKIGVLQQLLARELNVLSVDVDMVWLKDPFEVLEPNQSDFLVSVDSSADASDAPQSPCAGVIFARATDSSRALVKTWLELAREEGGGASLLFPRAWASTQSRYQSQLTVSYLPTAEFPNGCAQISSKWDIRRVAKASAHQWVMWHAACIQGLAQKLKALQGVARFMQSS